MPAETAPHDRTWMAWPSQGYTLGDTSRSRGGRRARTWAAVANAVVEFEPVTVVVVAPTTSRSPRDYLAPGRRASSPPPSTTPGCATSARPSSGRPTARARRRRLGLQRLGRPVLGHLGARTPGSAPFVGGLAGAERHRLVRWSTRAAASTSTALGTVLLTETVQLDPGRNPGLTAADVEAELARTIGATTCIWLPRGLTRDYDEFGTRGHVDIVATIAVPGRRAAARAAATRRTPTTRSRASSSELPRGRPRRRGERFEVVEVPAPRTLDGRRGARSTGATSTTSSSTAASSPAPSATRRTTTSLRDPRATPTRAAGWSASTRAPLFARGGGIHCITQQQPAL